jgi:proteic killer suppression protein
VPWPGYERGGGGGKAPHYLSIIIGPVAHGCTLDVLRKTEYICDLMIRSFRDRATELLWMGTFVKRFSGLEKQALRKLDMLHHARDLNDLRVPPANRLETLAGDRRGQHSIRINDQWRICFVWTKEGPADVEIVDYH